MDDRQYRKLFSDLPVLETNRLILRKFRAGDLYDINEYSSKEKVPRYLLWTSHLNLKETQGYLDYMFRRYRKAILICIYALFPSHRKEFNTNINNMDTMLLGGLWHGASFNFITWGALNGAGILVYKWWKKLTPKVRILAVLILLSLSHLLCALIPCALLNMLTFAMTVIAVAIVALCVWRLLKPDAASHGKSALNTVTLVWNTLLTFVFISFTRLFFRSGSNLNPAEANQQAWQTASQMVEKIGSHWNFEQIPPILSNYASVFIVFLFGMVVHWLPERFKRRYRLAFAQLPVWLMILISVGVIFLIYQFITADLQPFIYFQF